MAIYTIQIKTVSRSAGHSATAKIAYNCRDKITDMRSGEIHKYDSKKMSADLIHSEITHKDLTLDKKERSEIWNNAELAENRKDSRTAREYVVALPKELSNEQNILLVREFAAELTCKFNNVADWAIHAGKDGNGNIHAHILTTTRTFDPETKQLGERTSIEWNNTKCQANNVPVTQEQIKIIRKDWEQMWIKN
jgi:ATP-dependent exoDNAse (exonuclease V) alpha subunit